MRRQMLTALRCVNAVVSVKLRSVSDDDEATDIICKSAPPSAVELRWGGLRMHAPAGTRSAGTHPVDCRTHATPISQLPQR